MAFRRVGRIGGTFVGFAVVVASGLGLGSEGEAEAEGESGGAFSPRPMSGRSVIVGREYSGKMERNFTLALRVVGMGISIFLGGREREKGSTDIFQACEAAASALRSLSVAFILPIDGGT